MGKKIYPSEALKDYINMHKTHRDFARKVGIDNTYLSRLMAGKRPASTDLVAKVQELTGFTFSKAWVVRDEKRTA